MSEAPGSAIHLDLDAAWDDLPLRKVDARAWGPSLRFSSPARVVERFARELSPQLSRFIVYGSGDFHHLSALWLRRLMKPVTLVCFDNHPDWDVRPPRWACGGWINRALELPQVEQVAVWGCGSFECWWPQQLWGNRKAERTGKLEVHPWADNRSPAEKERRGAILRGNWRKRFADFAEKMAGRNVYVSIDLDCLAPEFACTNWENGKFTLDEVRWGLREIRGRANVVAGDLCGAYSAPVYARLKQRLASGFDHPKLILSEPDAIRATNRAAFDALWPVLSQ